LRKAETKDKLSQEEAVLISVQVPNISSGRIVI